MEAFIVIVILVVVAVVGLKIYNAMKDSEIVICSSCSNKFSMGHFKKKGECPKCGSDLIHKTGTRAGNI